MASSSTITRNGAVVPVSRNDSSSEVETDTRNPASSRFHVRSLTSCELGLISKILSIRLKPLQHVPFQFWEQEGFRPQEGQPSYISVREGDEKGAQVRIQDLFLRGEKTQIGRF